MASTVASLEFPSSRTQSTFRMPRLQYRNVQCNSDFDRTVSIECSEEAVSTDAISPTRSSFCPPKESPADLTNSASLRSSSVSSSMAASRLSKKSPKKKPSFFSGLFSAKEPSSQAFAEYQKTLLKQGHGRTNTVTLPGVSSARLPPTVPKVNSKWDGVPETRKEKGKQKPESRQSATGGDRPASDGRSAKSPSRLMSTSTSQRRLSRSTLGGHSTYSSGSGTNRLADLYGWELNSPTISSSSSAVVDFASEHRPTTSRLQTSHGAPASLEQPPLPDKACLFPDDPSPSHQPSSQSLSSQPSPSASSLPDVPSLMHSPALTLSDSAPATPSQSPLREFAFQESYPQASQPDNVKVTVLEAPVSVDEVIIKSASFKTLGPPATAKRRAKIPQDLPGADLSRTAGYELPLNSILKKEPRAGLDSYFPNQAPPSLATSTKQNTPHDQGLGLGLKTSGIAPWTSPGNDSGAPALIERSITPTPERKQSMKKKSGISMFRK